MAGRIELLKEIDQLPPQYLSEVFDFVGSLRKKVKNQNDNDIGAYMAMAADAEREKEASEWCNAYFGPALPINEAR